MSSEETIFNWSLDQSGSAVDYLLAQIRIQKRLISSKMWQTTSDAKLDEILQPHWDLMAIADGDTRQEALFCVGTQNEEDVFVRLGVFNDSKYITVLVVARDPNTVNKYLEEIKEHIPIYVTRGDGMVSFHFWADNEANGPTVHVRKLQVPDWNEQRGNYPSDTQASLDNIMHLQPPFNGGNLILWHGEPGTGKAQPLDARVLTPTGWGTIGELQPYDEVIGQDGNPTSVTAIHDRGLLDLYRVTLSDSTSLEVAGDHLWLVKSHGDQVHNQPGRVRSTSEIRDMLLDGKKRRLYLPLVEPVTFDDQEEELPISPYFLGLLLGDGSFRPNTVSFSSADPELIEAASKFASEIGVHAQVESHGDCQCIRFTGNGKGKNALLNSIRELGLIGKYSVEKFIPDRYMFSSIENRLSLLQGLMDTDGGAEATSNVFSTSSELLATQVAELVQLLGGTAYSSNKVPKYDNGAKSGKRAYRVSIRLPLELAPFKLERKLASWCTRPHNPPVRSIVSVEPSRQATPSRCISVEANDNLYVTEHGIVTHNSYAIRALAKQWTPWCDISYIVDPDRMFGRAEYLLEVIMNQSHTHFLPEDPDSPPPCVKQSQERSKLLIVEDADEFLRIDAKERAGQSLSRLLNTTDGLIGQGLSLILLITTNEPLTNIHPAVSRHGRCMANVNFERFTEKNEIDKWLGESTNRNYGQGITLAEMFDMRREQGQINVARKAYRAGTYL